MAFVSRSSGIAAAILFAFAGSAFADNDRKDAEEQRIEQHAKAEKERCEKLKDNEQDVCEAKAKADEKVAKAQLDAKYDPTPRNRWKVEQLKAEGEYEVAKQQCQSLKGDSQTACRKRAEERYEQAKANLENDRELTSQKR